MRDLIEKLNQLQRNEIKISEAPVQPGERKGISFKLKRLEKLSNELDKYKNSLQSMKYMELPPALKAEMKQIEEKLNTEIDKVSQAYQIEYEKSKVNDRPVKMDNLFKALAKNCKEIIKVYKELNRNNFEREKFLFRGIRSSDDALYGKPFEARKPKDSNRELHELVNGAINKMGFDSNRENSMFVTGDRSQAAGYGYGLYIMFPVDGFKFTWSQTVKDLILDSSKKLEMLDKDVVAEIREIVKQAKAADPNNAHITYPDDLFTSGYNYESDRERLMRAVEDGKLPDKIEDLLDDILTNESIQKHFEFTDQDLFRAILSGKEIYVKGNYYAINMEYRHQLFKFLEDINTDDVILPKELGEVPEVLDKGDLVRILSGQQAGKLGTVTYTYTESYEVYVGSKIGTITLKKEQVELYKLPDGSIPVYENDDKVIVVDPDIKIYGDVATVTFVNPNGKVDITTKNGNYHSVYKNQIEKYTPEREQEILKDLETRPPIIEPNDLVVVSDPESEFYKRRGKVNYVYSTGLIEVYLQNSGDYVDFQPSQLTLVDNATPDLLPKQAGVFNLGDSVQVTSGEWEGYRGKVVYLYSNGDKAEIDLVGLDKRIDVWLKQIVHIDQESEPTDSSEIKVGDNIKVTNSESGYYGEVGTVVEVGQDNAGKKWIKFKNDQLHGGVKTFIDWVEKVGSQTTFKKGDKVQIVDKQNLYNGKEGTVTSGPDEDGDYKITVVNNITYVPAAGLKKSDSPAVTFAIGDKVKIITNASGFYGKIGVIEGEPDSDGDYVVRFNDDDWLYCQPDEIEKVEEPKAATKFEVGDIVKATGPSAYSNSSYIGYGGTITSISDDGNFAGVEFDQDNILTYDVSNLSKGETDEIGNLTWEPEPEVKAPIKIGDTVKNIKDNHPHYGQTGVVNKIYHPGNVGLVYDDGTQAIDPGNWLEKVDAPETSTTTTQSQFAEGDKVEVVSGFPSLLGQTGTIMQVSPNYDFVSVQLDGNSVASSFPSSALKKIDQVTPEFKLGDLIEVTNPNVSSFGVKGNVTDQDINMLVIQDPETNKVFFVKKANVKKIG